MQVTAFMSSSFSGFLIAFTLWGRDVLPLDVFSVNCSLIWMHSISFANCLSCTPVGFFTTAFCLRRPASFLGAIISVEPNPPTSSSNIWSISLDNIIMSVKLGFRVESFFFGRGIALWPEVIDVGTESSAKLSVTSVARARSGGSLLSRKKLFFFVWRIKPSLYLFSWPSGLGISCCKIFMSSAMARSYLLKLFCFGPIFGRGGATEISEDAPIRLDSSVGVS